ncbi:MAG TPA: YceH family protein, partial [Acidimicrobiales bacterium]|nr:YceH family protein [Acidimicrobiales bacterium]
LATAPRTSEPAAGEPAAGAVGLSAPQGRIVGSRIEKQLVTPQQYPLTLNALVLACNQASNRDPVVAYAEEQVVGALDELKERRLVRFVLPSHGRSVVRYRHVLDEAFGIDAPQLAILAMLLLRGPQTVGELRTRTDRMASFDGLAAVEHELALLAGAAPPLVARLARRPGQKEERWDELLREPDPSGDAPLAPVSVADPGSPGAPGGSPSTVIEESPGLPAGPPSGLASSLAELRSDVDRLTSDVASVRAALEELRASLGG